MHVKVTSDDLDDVFEGVIVEVNEISYLARKPGWKCRKCGWIAVTQGLPWGHDCPGDRTAKPNNEGE